jgi:hypothetical protein
MPPQAPNRTIATLDGDHSLKSDVTAVAAAVSDWLPQVR